MTYEANKISARLVEELTPEQLTRLLLILVHLECVKHSLQGFHYISQKITVADGGEDGRVELSDIGKSNWFKNKLTLFQCKATDIGPEACKNEILVPEDPKKQTRELKPLIKELLDDGGQYILFVSKNYGTGKKIKDRIAKFCEAAGTNYEQTQFLIYDAQKISEWANEFIPAVTFVLECSNKSRPDGFRTWTQWERDIEYQLAYPYVLSKSLADKTLWLKDGLKKSNCLRILGHSGIGKSRFLFEALKPLKDDTEQTALNSSVIYIDLSLIKFESISHYFIANKDSTVATFVIDNCPDNEHITLSTLVRSNSQIKIVTADFSIETDEDPSSVIFLTKSEQSEVVFQMLKDLYQGKYGDDEIKRLADLAEGYPRMVEFLKHAVDKSGLTDVIADLPSQFVKKLIFGRGEQNKTELEILKCCSIFAEFAFADEESSKLLNEKEEVKIKEVNTYLASLVNQSLSYREFVATCKRIRDSRRIFERRGLHYTVVPTPLAAHLAADWLIEFPDADFQELSLQLTKHGLIDPFCRRLKTLNQVDRARSIVSRLWGPGGPFISAEVLNSELGSRLFCSVVEVSPEETVDALAQTLSIFSNDDLKENFGPGRRYIIWALEKLAFRKETFERAAKLMARFAIAENENISNNATGQFLHLFHIYLPGTEASYKERMNFVDACLSTADSATEHLIVRALGRALQMGHFDRFGGAEKQGSGRPLKDYSPLTWDEIYEFWNFAYQKLKTIALSGSEHKLVAKENLAAAIRWSFENGNGKAIANTLEEIIAVDNSLWEDAISNLRETASRSFLSDDDRKIINGLLIKLRPIDLADQIKLVVSLPDWTDADEDGIGNTSELKAETFAAELVNKNTTLQPYLASLLKGEQRQAFVFGKKIGEIINDPFSFGKSILTELKIIDEPLRNLELLHGFLVGAPSNVKRRLIDLVINDDDLKIYSFMLTRAITPEWIDLEKLFPLVEDGILEAHHFNNFIYGRCLDKLTADEVIKFSKLIFEYGNDGKWAALQVLSQYSHFNSTLWLSSKDTLRQFLCGFNYMKPSDAKGRLDFYKWSSVAEKLLSDDKDPEFAEIISKQLVEVSGHHLLSYQSYVTRVVIHLIKNYFVIFWKNISPLLLQNGSEYLNLKFLLGTRNGNSMQSEGILFSGNNETILTWCKANDLRAAKRIGYMMPLMRKSSNGEVTWHPFAKEMIDTFGDHEEFLNEVAANLGTFGSIGSVIPYYRDQQSLMKQLLNHKHASVRTWSKKGIESLERQIRREKLNEEQEFLE